MKLIIHIISLLFATLCLGIESDHPGELVKSSKKEAIQKCPKTGKTKWCARIKKCVRPCHGCLEPRVTGGEYICGPRTCRTWEKCIKQSTCEGSIFGKSYIYQPEANDPCAEEFFY